MEYRELGRSGLRVSVVGLGCNNFGMRIDEEASRHVIEGALAAGVNFFDTADMYGGGKSEEFLGRILGARRRSVLIGTKFGALGMMQKKPWGGKAAVMRCIDDSLRRLGTDYIDLYQMHYPDPATPIEETLDALAELVRQGKVRAIGCSNFSGAQIEAAEAAARARGTPRFESAQNEWSLLNRAVEAEVIPACERLGLGQLPYFPLASGMLTGKHRRGQPIGADSRLSHEYFKQFASEQNFARVEGLARVAQAHKRSLLELAMSWLASQPCVASVIAGSTRPEQVKANVAAVGWKLSQAERAEIDGALASAG
jgi:aryl-alcohol dehydrogenase-like predicted oxidoreductase